MKNSNDTFRESKPRPSVPQPTAPPRAPTSTVAKLILCEVLKTPSKISDSRMLYE